MRSIPGCVLCPCGPPACSGKCCRPQSLSGTDQFWEGQGQGSCLSLCLLGQPFNFAASEVGFLVGLFPGADTSFGRDVSILLLSQITPLALTGCPGNKGWHQALGRQSRSTKAQGRTAGSQKLIPLPVSHQLFTRTQTDPVSCRSQAPPLLALSSTEPGGPRGPIGGCRLKGKGTPCTLEHKIPCTHWPSSTDMDCPGRSLYRYTRPISTPCITIASSHCSVPKRRGP